MKKIINDPTAVVDEMLDGLAYIHSDLVYRVEGFDIIARKSEKTGKVGLISGGGSGHEPSHAGFVGEGMLSAAICGAVFTSPTPDQVLQAIKEADEGAGVFMVIKNYSGDIMNFEMAQEMAEMEGYRTVRLFHADIKICSTTGQLQICNRKRARRNLFLINDKTILFNSYQRVTLSNPLHPWRKILFRVRQHLHITKQPHTAEANRIKNIA